MKSAEVLRGFPDISRLDLLLREGLVRTEVIMHAQTELVSLGYKSKRSWVKKEHAEVVGSSSRSFLRILAIFPGRVIYREVFRYDTSPASSRFSHVLSVHDDITSQLLSFKEVVLDKRGVELIPVRGTIGGNRSIFRQIRTTDGSKNKASYNYNRTQLYLVVNRFNLLYN